MALAETRFGLCVGQSSCESLQLCQNGEVLPRELRTVIRAGPTFEDGFGHAGMLVGADRWIHSPGIRIIQLLAQACP